MSESKISLPAGSACASCNNPDPCLSEITVDKFDGEKHIWPTKKKIHLKLLDAGKGKEGTIAVKSKCSPPENLKAELKSENEVISIKKPITLYYKSRSDQANSEPFVDSIWSYLGSITSPTDLNNGPHEYRLFTECCTGQSSYVKIDVYPTVELQLQFDVMYSHKGEERPIKERRDEQIKARKKMEDVKPKNSNKLRTGWTGKTDQFKLTKTCALEFEYSLDIAGMSMSAKMSEATKKVQTIKKLEQLSKFEQIISNIENHLLPDPNAEGSRKYRSFELSVDPAKLGIAYAFRRTESVDEGTHFSGLYASPFLSMKMKVDLIQLIAAYCKVDKIAAKCREYIEKGGDSLECFIQLTTALHLSIGAAYSKDQWAFDAGDDNKLGFTLEGVVSLAFKAKVLFIEASLSASATLKTEAGFKLDQHDDGIDLVGYHDGIVGEVALLADVKMEGDNEESSYELSSTDKVVFAAPLEASESRMRINLCGKQRVLPKRKISVIQPWAMGSNPISGSSSQSDNGTGPWAMGSNPKYKS